MIIWQDWEVDPDAAEVRVMMAITYRLAKGMSVDGHFIGLVLLPHYDYYFVDGDMDLWQTFVGTSA